MLRRSYLYVVRKVALGSLAGQHPAGSDLNAVRKLFALVLLLVLGDLLVCILVLRVQVLEDLLYSKEPNLSSDQNKALYLDFCIRNKGLTRKTVEFKHTLQSDPYFNALRLKFGYAITCHKAQGSEWNHVFVKCKSHQSQLTSDYFRWLYTAITRTAGHLYLLDPPNLRSNTKLVSNPGIDLFQASGTIDATHLTNSPRTTSAPEGVSSGANDDQSAFGIPATATFLRSLLNEVRQIISAQAVVVDDIQHNLYQEAYVFKRGTELARINVGYNSKYKVTHIASPQLTELSAELVNLLAPLQWWVPPPSGAIGNIRDLKFDEPFLNEYHQSVNELCVKVGIAIRNVVKQDWFLRYTFIRESEVAVYDIWYNKKGQINSCMPRVKECTPGVLVGDVGILLTEGMRA